MLDTNGALLLGADLHRSAASTQTRVLSPPRAPTIPHTSRFVFDGQSRVHNFLNERVGASHATPQPLASTSRTAYFQDDTDEQQPGTEDSPRKATGLMATQRARSVTALSHLSRDPRFEQLQPPYSRGLGPGSYNTECGSPPLGPYSLESSLRLGPGAAPARDPWRPNSSFAAMERPSIFTYSEGHHLGSYVHPDDHQYKGLSERATHWSRSTDLRADPADYRHATRHSEADKRLPEVTAPDLDCTGRSTLLAESEHANLAKIPFESKQARMSLLPKDRLNDTRLGTQRRDVDPTAIGPGTYTPLISIGGAKRKTYRLYSVPPGTQRAPGAMTGTASLAFSSVTRAHKFGAFSPLADSALRGF